MLNLRWFIWKKFINFKYLSKTILLVDFYLDYRYYLDLHQKWYERAFNSLFGCEADYLRVG